MRVSLGFINCLHFDCNLFNPGSSLVCRCNRLVYDSCQLPSNGEWMCSSRRETLFLGSQRTEGYSCRYLCFGRRLCVFDQRPEVYPDACSLWSLPLHGNFFLEGVSNVCQSTDHLHACKVSTRLHFPSSGQNWKSASLHRHPITLLRCPLDRQVLQTYFNCFSSHGKKISQINSSSFKKLRSI